MNAHDAIRHAVQQGMACNHRGRTCEQVRCRVRRVRPVVTAKLIEAHTAREWGWAKAGAIVMDTFDDLDDNYTIGNYETSKYVKAIDDALPPGMRFTITTATDRMVRSDA